MMQKMYAAKGNTFVTRIWAVEFWALDFDDFKGKISIAYRIEPRDTWYWRCSSQIFLHGIECEIVVIYCQIKLLLETFQPNIFGNTLRLNCNHSSEQPKFFRS